MQSNERSGSAGATMEEAADDLSPFLRKYRDGRIERLVTHTFVPASETPAASNGVATRDVVIDPDTGVSARMFLNVRAVTTSGRKLPVIVYFHGGGFCTGSAFSKLFHRYAASLSARAAALVVSVEYRLAPEHPIPAAFDDAWAALRWVTFSDDDPWLARHADRDRGVFLAGESAGAVIAHDVAARAASPEGIDDLVNIEGMILLHPFFWGPDRLPSETNDDDHRRHELGHKTAVFVPEKLDKFWPFLTAGTASNDDPRADPPAEVVASVACRRALVAVAAMDLARHRGRRYAEWLQRHGRWCREVTLVESEDEDHAFHLYRPGRASAVALMDRVVEFVNGGGGERTPALPEKKTVVGVVETPVTVMNLHASVVGAYDDKQVRRNTLLVAKGSGGNNNKVVIRVTPPRWSVARNALVVGRPGKAASVLPRFGLLMGAMQ
ncbi:hypothetical protein PR202_gb25112 [Eleusine coracana subsp. coracana]|uniref:Alpha/beta hydrolase fold-3 domain-containing protein n=1 Tax=Eleusine coracana subsp. coracana TaxID=191504 RepID=A0AAV5FKR2_ELECO|nr:hypothetical protein QOZ80_5BG0455600 [Eleusine coracana subsp. coracana]GJN36269.1 hypothetical protein PR202_gb25112 [Eleusine coracana subsp. coracana]